MATVTINSDVFHRVVACAAFTGRDDMAPILSGVQLSTAGGELRAVATDRYTAVRMAHPHSDVDELPAVVIPAKLLTDALKLAAKSAFVTVTHDSDSGTVTIDCGTGAFTAPAIAGNYPPVERLYWEGEDADIPAGTILDPTLLARLAKLTRPGRRPADRVVGFTLGSKPGEDGRNVPVRARGDHYDALIQPRRP